MARPLALTLGEPAGIGLDITLAAWRRRDELKLTPFYFLADPAFVARRAKRMAPDLTIAFDGRIPVEEVSDLRIDHAFQELSARGLPAVRGEIVEGDVAGYHYYPGRERVIEWFSAEGRRVLEETYKREDPSWGYHHFLLCNAA